MPGVATGGYGPLEALARNRVNLTKVTTHRPDMLRGADSLVNGHCGAFTLSSDAAGTVVLAAFPAESGTTLGPAPHAVGRPGAEDS